MKKPYTAAERLSVLLGTFGDAWFVMLLLGVAHSGDSRVPALGYWVTLALVFAGSLVVGNGALRAIMTDSLRK